jgi:hypothetical protein
MLKDIVRHLRKTRKAVEDHPIAVELKSREETAFSLLDPQVRLVKASPTVQIVVGTVVMAAVLSGNWGTAAVIGGAWLGSRPLTHATASAVAGVGMVDQELLAAIERLQTLAAEPA